jgi:hypothetical protein
LPVYPAEQLHVQNGPAKAAMIAIPL